MIRRMLWLVVALTMSLAAFSAPAGAHGDDDDYSHHGGGGWGDDDDGGGPGGDDDDHHGGGWGDDDDNGTTTTTTTTTPGNGCDDYTPTNVVVSPATLQPGSQINVSGGGVPGDTVVVTLTGPGGGGGGDDDDGHDAWGDDDDYHHADDDDHQGGNQVEIELGTAVVQPDGTFSLDATLPADLSPGNYTITVTSTQCPASTSVSVTVYPLSTSSCRAGRSSRTFLQGESVQWQLDTGGFNWAKPVELRLRKGSYNAVLYSGPWPPNSKTVVQIPADAPPGKFLMEQVGTKRGSWHLPKTKRCRVWVALASSPVLETSAPAAPGGSSVPVLLPVLGVVAGVSLIRLRMNRWIKKA